MPIEKVNNVFEQFSKNGNKPVSKPAVYTPVKKNTEGDTFYKRHKTAVITGGIIAGIIALGAAAKKGLLGESIQGFINKITGSTSSVSAEKINTPPAPQKIETIVPESPVSVNKIQTETAAPEIPLQKINNEAQALTVQADAGTAERISNDTQIPEKFTSAAAPDERLTENADDIVQNAVPDVQKLNSETNSLQPEAKNTVTKNPDEISPVQTESSDLSAAAQAESAVSKIEETAPLKVKEVLCDLSDKSCDFNPKFNIQFYGSDEKITFRLPDSSGRQQHNGGIYGDLKYSYGDGWENGIIRDIYSGVDRDVEAVHDGFIKNLDKSLETGKFDSLDDESFRFVLGPILLRESDETARQAAGRLILNFRLDEMTKEEIEKGTALLRTIRKNMSSFDNFKAALKKSLLEDVDSIYAKINENIEPLSVTSHAYRGIHRGVTIGGLDGIKYCDFLSNLKEGEIVTPDAGAMFVTGYPKGAIEYASKDGVLLHIIMPKGVKMEEAHFMESLMPPMAKYKVLANRQVGSNGFRVIDLEYLADQGTRSFPQ